MNIAVSIFITALEFYIPAEHSPGEKILPRIHPLSSAPVRYSEAKPGSGRAPDHFPLQSQSGCKSQHWTERQPGCWKRASSSAPSQRALCCARRGCWRAPACHLRDSVPGRATVSEDNAGSCLGQTWAPFWRWTHLPIPTKRPGPVSPVPAAWHIVIPVSGP